MGKSSQLRFWEGERKPELEQEQGKGNGEQGRGREGEGEGRQGVSHN